MSSITWTAASAVDSTLSVATASGDFIVVGILVTGQLSGQLSFEVSPDGTNWFPKTIESAGILNDTSTTALVTGSSGWRHTILGWNDFRVRLSTPLIGTGSVLVIIDVATGSGGGGVASVTAGDVTIVIGGTSTDPTVERAAITGDVDIPSGSDTSELVAIQGTSIAAPSGGATHYLDAAGTWTVPAGTGGFVTSVTAGNGTVTIGGSSTAPTVAVTPGVFMTEAVYDPAGIDQQVLGTTATQTFSGKRYTRRNVAVTQSATPAIDSDNMDIATITGLSQPITSMSSGLTGTPNDGDKLEIRITDDGTAQTITWGASFTSTTVSLPTTTVISTRIRIGFEWDAAASVWACIAVA